MSRRDDYPDLHFNQDGAQIIIHPDILHQCTLVWAYVFEMFASVMDDSAAEWWLAQPDYDLRLFANTVYCFLIHWAVKLVPFFKMRAIQTYWKICSHRKLQTVS